MVERIVEDVLPHVRRTHVQQSQDSLPRKWHKSLQKVDLTGLRQRFSIQGKFRFERSDGSTFESPIPPFALDSREETPDSTGST